MAVLAWWVVPIAVALVIGAIVSMWGRRPRIRRAFEEVEYFHRYLISLKRQTVDGRRRGRRTTA